MDFTAFQQHMYIVEGGQTYLPVILEVPGATIITTGVAVNVSK
jgi:hypothetical protein